MSYSSFWLTNKRFVGLIDKNAQFMQAISSTKDCNIGVVVFDLKFSRGGENEKHVKCGESAFFRDDSVWYCLSATIQYFRTKRD